MHTLKKDQFVLCASHNDGNITEEEFAAHLKQKEPPTVKERDIQLCTKNDETLLYFADLQKMVLPLSLNASNT